MGSSAKPRSDRKTGNCGTKRKTDNAFLDTKLALRRHFLDRYHGGQAFSALNCCEGDDVCWQALRQEYPACQVAGFDVKRKRGRVAIDSSRVLGLSGWRYDVVDIDTYGHPFKHLFALMRTMPEKAVTVFLTFGRIKYGGADSEIVKLAGLGRFSVKPPVSLISKALEDSLPYALTHECAAKIKVVYAAEAFPRENARYIGLRLEKSP